MCAENTGKFENIKDYNLHIEKEHLKIRVFYKVSSKDTFLSPLLKNPRVDMVPVVRKVAADSPTVRLATVGELLEGVKTQLKLKGEYKLKIRKSLCSNDTTVRDAFASADGTFPHQRDAKLIEMTSD